MTFVYSAGTVKDWVTESVGLACTLREVSAMSDAALAELIQKDHIDVLIDLSGHTAGFQADCVCASSRTGPGFLAGLFCHYRTSLYRCGIAG